jgi:death-on-curing protein
VNEPLWLDERDAVTVHDRLLAIYGGAGGVREHGLLASALARPRQHFAYARACDIAQLAAIYTGGIVGGHPFVDGNKRTGFLIGILFLELNGYQFMASEEDAANAVLSLAAGSVEEVAYAGFLRANVKAVETDDA